jgi:hypothetical protein
MYERAADWHTRRPALAVASGGAQQHSSLNRSLL